jgi:hypothetical protein
MIPITNDSDSLLLLVYNKGLFQDLVKQLKKDFELSGLLISSENTQSTDQLLFLLYQYIYNLIQVNFEKYLQLLYRVDVPENKMQADNIQDIEDFAKKATFLILKREWEKVYYRELYS